MPEASIKLFKPPQKITQQETAIRLFQMWFTLDPRKKKKKKKNSTQGNREKHNTDQKKRLFCEQMKKGGDMC